MASEPLLPHLLPYFFMKMLPETGAMALLAREEAKHAIGSKRLIEGDVVALFDGKGGVAEAVLGSERRRDGALSVVVRSQRCEPALAPSIALATAIPKGDRFATLLDMSAQLGVNRIVPLICERSAPRSGSIHIERARRVLTEACKQSRRAWIPELVESMAPVEFVSEARSRGDAVLLAHPGGTPASYRCGTSAQAPARSAESTSGGISILVGPEGGFSEREVAACVAAGATTLSLGPAILRIETACAALLALLRMP